MVSDGGKLRIRGFIYELFHPAPTDAVIVQTLRFAFAGAVATGAAAGSRLCEAGISCIVPAASKRMVSFSASPNPYNARTSPTP